MTMYRGKRKCLHHQFLLHLHQSFLFLFFALCLSSLFFFLTYASSFFFLFGLHHVPRCLCLVFLFSFVFFSLFPFLFLFFLSFSPFFSCFLFFHQQPHFHHLQKIVSIFSSLPPHLILLPCLFQSLHSTPSPHKLLLENKKEGKGNKKHQALCFVKKNSEITQKKSCSFFFCFTKKRKTRHNRPEKDWKVDCGCPKREGWIKKFFFFVFLFVYFATVSFLMALLQCFSEVPQFFFFFFFFFYNKSRNCWGFT